MPTPSDVTLLARRWSSGDERAFDALVGRVYPDLRTLARRQLRAPDRDRALSTTVLVHEAYLKLADAEGQDWRDRAHLFAFCAKVMRHLLVDFARRKSARRRGGGWVRVTLDEHPAHMGQSALDILVLDEALERIAARDERMARIVEYRFFGGMSVPETAEALGTSTRTVEREWARARAYLQHALSSEG